jgi:hypothetical protein
MMDDLKELMTVGDEVVAVLDFGAAEKHVVTKRGRIFKLTRNPGGGIRVSPEPIESNGGPPGP